MAKNIVASHSCDKFFDTLVQRICDEKFCPGAPACCQRKPMAAKCTRLLARRLVLEMSFGDACATFFYARNCRHAQNTDSTNKTHEFMTPTTLNSRCFSRAWQAVIALLFFVAINAQAAPVAEDVVRRVAQNYIANHIANFGNWNGGLIAEIESVELVRYKNTPVAYSVAVRPSGYLLVAYDDDFSPVLLYSDRGSFLPSRVAEFGSAESWIIPETHAVKANIASRRSELKSMLQDGAVEQTKLNSKSWQAWVHFDKSVAEFSKAANEQRKSGVVSGSATAGPFLTTAWDQGESLAPFTYNLYTPMDPGSGNKLGCLGTVTGCVATATAQIMRYWSWPDSGQGSSRYTWQPKSGASAVELSANYARVYDWASMPDSLTSTSLSAQIDAVARLMRDVGVSAEMRYGCAADGSGASAAKAASSLASFFK
jgi:hypothetical protein